MVWKQQPRTTANTLRNPGRGTQVHAHVDKLANMQCAWFLAVGYGGFSPSQLVRAECMKRSGDRVARCVSIRWIPVHLECIVRVHLPICAAATYRFQAWTDQQVLTMGRCSMCSIDLLRSLVLSCHCLYHSITRRSTDFRLQVGTAKIWSARRMPFVCGDAVDQSRRKGGCLHRCLPTASVQAHGQATKTCYLCLSSKAGRVVYAQCYLQFELLNLQTKLLPDTCAQP